MLTPFKPEYVEAIQTGQLKVFCKDGQEVRVVASWDASEDYPIVVLDEGKPYLYDRSGKPKDRDGGKGNVYDLFVEPPKPEVAMFRRFPCPQEDGEYIALNDKFRPYYTNRPGLGQWYVPIDDLINIQIDADGMHHSDIVNCLILKFGYKSYLELGVDKPELTYDKINSQFKECCDNNPNLGDFVTYRMSTDEMFASMDKNKKYDIIFIDAMHDEDYVDRDIHNAIEHLNPNGVICVHDTIPLGKWATAKKEKYSDIGENEAWNGDVYKSIAKLYGTGIDYYTINNSWDSGLTIIKPKPGQNIELNKKCPYEFEDLFVDGNDYPDNLTAKGRRVMRITKLDDIQ